MAKRIDVMKARGSLSYALGSTIASDGSTVIGSQVFFWGKVPAGLNMKLYSQSLGTPEVLDEVSPYNFSKLMIETDFALGLGHAVKLTFQLPGEEKAQRFGEAKDVAPPRELEMLAIPVFEGVVGKSVDEIASYLGNFKGDDVGLINDFDVPYVCLKGPRCPNVPRKKVKRLALKFGDKDDRDSDDDDESGEGSGSDAESEEEEPSDEEEDGSDAKSGDSQSEASGSGSEASGRKRSKREKPVEQLGFRITRSARPPPAKKKRGRVG